MFCASPKFLSQTKNLIAFSHSSKSFEPAQKLNLLSENHLLVWHEMFLTGAICLSIFGLVQKLGLAQNILGPVEEQGICKTFCLMISSCLLCK